jgi:hypothetical protein
MIDNHNLTIEDILLPILTHCHHFHWRSDFKFITFNVVSSCLSLSLLPPYSTIALSMYVPIFTLSPNINYIPYYNTLYFTKSAMFKHKRRNIANQTFESCFRVRTSFFFLSIVATSSPVWILDTTVSFACNGPTLRSWLVSQTTPRSTERDRLTPLQ